MTLHSLDVYFNSFLKSSLSFFPVVADNIEFIGGGGEGILLLGMLQPQMKQFAEHHIIVCLVCQNCVKNKLSSNLKSNIYILIWMPHVCSYTNTAFTDCR